MPCALVTIARSSDACRYRYPTRALTRPAQLAQISLRNANPAPHKREVSLMAICPLPRPGDAMRNESCWPVCTLKNGTAKTGLPFEAALKPVEAFCKPKKLPSMPQACCGSNQ